MIITRAKARERRDTADVSGLRGFTLLELTAVVAIITILVSLLSAALNQTKMKAFRISCLDNLKQLQFAWDFYIDDNDGSLPLNQTIEKAGAKTNGALANSWVFGNPREDRTSENIRRGTLFPYIKSVEAYRCPMDDSTVDGNSEILR